MEKNKKTKILMIVGHGHSGSTLLDKVLGNQFNGFSGGELIVFSRLSTKQDIFCGCSTAYSKCNFWKKVNQSIIEEVNICEDEIPEKFNTHLSLTRKDYFFSDSVRHLMNLLTGFKFVKKIHKEALQNTKKLYKTIESKTDCDYIVDSSKILNRAIYLKHILKDDFDIKIIHLIRDGRAVLSSFHRKEIVFNLHDKETGETIEHRKKKNKLNPNMVMLKWALQNIYISFYCNVINSKNTVFVKYEEFTSNPGKTIGLIFKKFGIQNDGTFLDLKKASNHMMGGHASRVNATEIKPNIGKWKYEVPDSVKRRFSFFVGFINRLYGYK